MLFNFYLCILLISSRIHFCHIKNLGVQDLLLIFLPMQWACSLLIILQSALMLLLLLLGFFRWLNVSILFAPFAEKNALRTLQVHSLLLKVASESRNWNLNVPCTVQSRIVIIKLGELVL